MVTFTGACRLPAAHKEVTGQEYIAGCGIHKLEGIKLKGIAFVVSEFFHGFESFIFPNAPDSKNIKNIVIGQVNTMQFI